MAFHPKHPFDRENGCGRFLFSLVVASAKYPLI
jgi:hypothetical protein